GLGPLGLPLGLDALQVTQLRLTNMVRYPRVRLGYPTNPAEDPLVNRRLGDAIHVALLFPCESGRSRPTYDSAGRTSGRRVETRRKDDRLVTFSRVRPLVR